jgi:hypothetical protein
VADRGIEIGYSVRRFVNSQKLATGPAVDRHGVAAENQLYPITKALFNCFN